MPLLVIVAGPNGSGKTTLVRSGGLNAALSLPQKSINADDIARSLAGDAMPSDAQSLQAARTADRLLDEHIAAGQSVIVETVLSSPKYKTRVAAARTGGFDIVLVYVTTRLADINIGRVANRFALGGHDVPEDRVRARRDRSHTMFEWFAREADQVFVFDNSTITPTVAAIKAAGGWTMLDLDLLPPDLATAISSLAAPADPSPDD